MSANRKYMQLRPFHIRRLQQIVDRGLWHEFGETSLSHPSAIDSCIKTAISELTEKLGPETDEDATTICLAHAVVRKRR